MLCTNKVYHQLEMKKMKQLFKVINKGKCKIYKIIDFFTYFH